MVASKRARLIVVLGMHRSGTSAITRALQVVGVELGSNLMAPIEDVNAKGFWEDIDFCALNIEALSALGSDWDHLASIGPDGVERLRKKGYFARAVELLRQKIGKSRIFGFKDPRVAKLLPFWNEVFIYCQLDTSFVLAMRHPLSVAKSLAKRNCFDPEKSYFLWLGHVLESLSGSAGRQCVLIDYDKLMELPEREINRIANQLDLVINTIELESYISEFLDEALQHTIYDLNELALDPACPTLVSEVYGVLLEAATDKKSLDDPALQEQISRWVQEWRRLEPVLVLADRFFTQNLIVNQLLSERDNQFGNLSQAHFETEARLRAIENSTSWRMTFPVRQALINFPSLRNFCRRAIKPIFFSTHQIK
jgi:hypothetical protein